MIQRVYTRGLSEAADRGAAAQKRPLMRAVACSGAEWRATVDEGGHYSFAVAL